MPRSYRLACDSLVALSSATADGSVLFAKNSDRPALECQPLMQVTRQSHPPGTRMRCTHIEIPQAPETARVIGSRPFWCWGFEHGLNEHGVAIGNHTVFTRDPLCGHGLIGMDLVRLGLERGRSAAQAVEVMTALIEEYGQGGSGYHDKDWPYHNSFLVADRGAAFVLEASDQRWALRRVWGVASLSNHLTIGSDWDALSDGAIEHAVAEGWWNEDRDGRFDFADAYRDTTVVPEVISSGRHQRTCTLLEHAHGMVSMHLLKGALRDHYGRPMPAADLTPADPRYFSVCMHAEPVGTTTASMIARIPTVSGEPPVYWASLGSPCVSLFIPLYVDADIPAVLSHGGERPDDSPWWLFRRLLTQVEADWLRRAPRVRAALDGVEAEIAECMRVTEITSKDAAARAAFMQRVVSELLERVRHLDPSS
ncbi:MAG: C69 family dipeptidase [Candidatus Binatia bacterium]